MILVLEISVVVKSWTVFFWDVTPRSRARTLIKTFRRNISLQVEVYWLSQFVAGGNICAGNIWTDILHYHVRSYVWWQLCLWWNTMSATHTYIIINGNDPNVVSGRYQVPFPDGLATVLTEVSRCYTVRLQQKTGIFPRYRPQPSPSKSLHLH
jgi:hypothetical protein